MKAKELHQRMSELHSAMNSIDTISLKLSMLQSENNVMLQQNETLQIGINFLNIFTCLRILISREISFSQ